MDIPSSLITCDVNTLIGMTLEEAQLFVENNVVFWSKDEKDINKRITEVSDGYEKDLRLESGRIRLKVECIDGKISKIRSLG